MSSCWGECFFLCMGSNTEVLYTWLSSTTPLHAERFGNFFGHRGEVPLTSPASPSPPTSPSPKQKNVRIQCFSEIPEEHQLVLKGMVDNDEDKEGNLDLIVKILRFTDKVKIKTQNSLPTIEDKDLQHLDAATKALIGHTKGAHALPLQCSDTNGLIMAAAPTIQPLEQAKKSIKVKEQAGEGGYGLVFEGARNKSKVAIKKMDHITRSDQHRNLREVAFLHYLHHSNIVKYEGAGVSDEELWLLMEWMDGGTLFEALSRHKFKEPSIAYVVREILKGLEYIHAQGIIHRDLKSKK